MKVKTGDEAVPPTGDARETEEETEYGQPGE